MVKSITIISDGTVRYKDFIFETYVFSGCLYTVKRSKQNGEWEPAQKKKICYHHFWWYNPLQSIAGVESITIISDGTICCNPLLVGMISADFSQKSIEIDCLAVKSLQ